MTNKSKLINDLKSNWDGYLCNSIRILGWTFGFDTCFVCPMVRFAKFTILKIYSYREDQQAK